MATRAATELARRGIPFIVYSGLRREACRCLDRPARRGRAKPGSGDALISPCGLIDTTAQLRALLDREHEHDADDAGECHSSHVSQ